MKKKIFLLTLSTIIAIILIRCIYFIVCTATYTPQEGDVIFHVSKSSQSAAIKIGTLSRYSHCGVIVMKKCFSYKTSKHLEISKKNCTFAKVLRKNP